MSRLRPAFVALAVAALVFAALAVAQRDGAGFQDDARAMVRVAATTGRHVSGQLARLDAPRAPQAHFTGLVALFISGIAFIALVGPQRRRLGDAGEGWRALLLGAPPALR